MTRFFTSESNIKLFVCAMSAARDKIGIVTAFMIDNHTDEDLKQYRTWLKDRLIIGIKLYCGYEYYYPNDQR